MISTVDFNTPSIADAPTSIEFGRSFTAWFATSRNRSDSTLRRSPSPLPPSSSTSSDHRALYTTNHHLHNSQEPAIVFSPTTAPPHVKHNHHRKTDHRLTVTTV
ncbi:hypothetical protein HanIR_Chr11g0546351 [Helianthus annuus]|nr:hypothetical protein HanIR_Chr11g0546351 [Helianthus annuus]